MNWLLDVGEKHFKNDNTDQGPLISWSVLFDVRTNACGMIFTANHQTNGLFLPGDDRQHRIA
ncbi:hypothetical protein JQ543_11750 [Bradyrhizobium diazoefficiens]|nr:hypothetical protein [Bradyrhizobium diazoefficiens]MBR0848416.1 hypothetical protein [Bradyrhizobium diazoefficiens]